MRYAVRGLARRLPHVKTSEIAVAIPIVSSTCSGRRCMRPSSNGCLGQCPSTCLHDQNFVIPLGKPVGRCNPRPPACVVTGHALEQAAVLVAPLGPRHLGHPATRTRHGRCEPLARAAAPPVHHTRRGPLGVQGGGRGGGALEVSRKPWYPPARTVPSQTSPRHPYAGAELNRLYPGCSISTSNHAV